MENTTPVTNEKPSKYRSVSGFWKAVICIMTAIAVIMSINQIFVLNIIPNMVENRYIYCIMALLVSIVFLLFPMNAKASRTKVPWYDAALFVLCLVTLGYFAVNSMTMLLAAWEFTAPPLALFFSIVLWLLIVEAVRRTSGTVMCVVVLIFSFYPLVAPYLPSLIAGMGFDFSQTVKYLIMGSEGITGTPTKIFCNEVIGFLLFGVVLQITGGGDFFMDLAFALMGKYRGGPAKVSVVSSALMGSISGSVISNVITTGTITIPTMKKNGYRPEVAAAVESCSSTGGVLMPPVMGAVAFIMSSFLGCAYADVAVAALLPGLLYYLSLVVQVDFYAAKNGLRGLPQEELPRLNGALKRGWWYILAIILLIYLMVFTTMESWSPFMVSAMLLVVANIYKSTRMKKKDWIDLIMESAKILAEILSVMASIGFIVGALSMTGMAQAFSSELVFFSNGNALLMLIMGALACFILGFGMTVSAAYIFLAIVLVPALETLGFVPMAVHMFVLYWGMLSYITPPVALAALTASSMAGGKFMKTGWEAMKMGVVLYFLPFFFVYNPALLLISDSVVEIVSVIITAVLGIIFLSASTQGYMPGIGKVDKSAKGYILRGVFFATGIMMMIPETITDIIGLAVTLVYLIYVFVVRNKKRAEA